MAQSGRSFQSPRSGQNARSGQITQTGQNTQTGRYTPPVPQVYETSPWWVLPLMLGFLGLGALTIVLNYLGVLPGSASNLYLLAGLVLITAGFITATRFR